MLTRNNLVLKSLGLIVMLFWTMIAAPTLSYAATNTAAADGGAIGKALCNVVDMLTGKIGKAIATVAIIFLAFGLFVGKVSWGVAVATGIGIAAIFGAPQIINMISGAGDLQC